MTTQELPTRYLIDCLNAKVRIRLVELQDVTGILHSFDVHNNVLLSDAEEHTLSKKTDGKIEVIASRSIGLLFIRGDRILTISRED